MTLHQDSQTSWTRFRHGTRTTAAVVTVGIAPVVAPASLPAQTPDYLDPDLPVERRVEDVVGRMTLEEEVSQMMDVAPAVERLDVPEYDWWNEALHGVARSGLATVFPQAIGFAATWNDSLVLEMATVISDEARPIAVAVDAGRPDSAAQRGENSRGERARRVRPSRVGRAAW